MGCKFKVVVFVLEFFGRRRLGSVSFIGVFGLFSGCVCVLRNVMDCLGIYDKG